MIRHAQPINKKPSVMSYSDRLPPSQLNINNELSSGRKREATPEPLVGKRELVNPTLHEFPSLHSPLHYHGLQVIRKTLGNDAFLVMTEIGTHEPKFQLSQKRVAELAGMSRCACDRAIQLLVVAGYIERVECRKSGRRHGHVLHSRLEGNVQKLDGYVTHYTVEANTKEAAMREKAVRAAHNPSNPDRPKTGRKYNSQQ